MRLASSGFRNDFPWESSGEPLRSPLDASNLFAQGLWSSRGPPIGFPSIPHNKNRGRMSRHVVFDQYSVELFDAAMKEHTGVGKIKIRFDELLVMMA